MDSITQIALGATVAAVCVKPGDRRKAAVMGACLGTLPDLDVLIDYGDAVSNFTYHRGFSHSLFVLFPLSITLWWLLKRIYQPVKESPRAWLFAIVLALVTHPLLDAHTVYGTQLFWPIPSPPVMWSTLFIIDPLYTLPLLVGFIAVLVRPKKQFSARALMAGLVLSTFYLGWTWVAKGITHNQATLSLGEQLDNRTLLTTPTPLNTFVWRVLVLDGDRYLEGYFSVLAPNKPIDFVAHNKNEELIASAQDNPAIKRLDWFSHGFIKGSLTEEYLVITDLRMGVEGSYVFNHAVAAADGNLREVTCLTMQLPQQTAIHLSRLSASRFRPASTAPI